jgi:hypothetical protein
MDLLEKNEHKNMDSPSFKKKYGFPPIDAEISKHNLEVKWK